MPKPDEDTTNTIIVSSFLRFVLQIKGFIFLLPLVHCGLKLLLLTSFTLAHSSQPSLAVFHLRSLHRAGKKKSLNILQPRRDSAASHAVGRTSQIRHWSRITAESFARLISEASASTMASPYI